MGRTKHPHPLVFLSQSSYPGGQYQCDSCQKVNVGEVYHCDECSYDNCPACYQTPQQQPQQQQQQQSHPSQYPTYAPQYHGAPQYAYPPQHYQHPPQDQQYSHSSVQYPQVQTHPSQYPAQSPLQYPPPQYYPQYPPQYPPQYSPQYPPQYSPQYSPQYPPQYPLPGPQSNSGTQYPQVLYPSGITQNHPQSPPLQSLPPQSPPVQSPPAQSPPLQNPPPQSPPVQNPPPQSPPVQSSPVQSPPPQSLPPPPSQNPSSLENTPFPDLDPFQTPFGVEPPPPMRPPPMAGPGLAASPLEKDRSPVVTPSAPPLTPPPVHHAPQLTQQAHSPSPSPVASSKAQSVNVEAQKSVEAWVASVDALAKQFEGQTLKPKANILLSFHSHDEQIAQKIAKELSSLNYAVFVCSEAHPSSLVEREQAVQWCHGYVALTSSYHQFAPALLELINYCASKKKPILQALAQAHFRPSGCLGSTTTSWPLVDFTLSNQSGTGFSTSINTLAALIDTNIVKPGLNFPPIPTRNSFSYASTPTSVPRFGVLASYHPDAKHIADILVPAINARVHEIGPGLHVNKKEVEGCRIYMPFMSPGFENYPGCREECEKARALGKIILPVKAIGSTYWPSGWLALAIAGKLYYELTSKDQISKPFFDSTPLKDFQYAIQVALEPCASQEERERIEKNHLNSEVEKAKAKLLGMGGKWPPPAVPLNSTPPDLKDAYAVASKEVTSTITLKHIHYEITRLTFVPPKALFDARGLPTNHKFDVMLSYQWDCQQMVRDIYMDLDMRNFKGWMDIWGGMQGNIYEAMARAIESTTVIVTFISKKYLLSPNCNIEFKYAVRRNRPLVVVFIEDNLTLPDFVKDAIKDAPQFNIKSYGDMGRVVNGVPTIDRICDKIRKLMTAVKSQETYYENSSDPEEIFQLKKTLHEALDAIDRQTGASRFKICSRCGAQYDSNSMAGCYVHRSYYVGGTIIAGRWTCCNQLEKTSPGCKAADHMEEPRKLVRDNSYGTWTWQPS